MYLIYADVRNPDMAYQKLQALFQQNHGNISDMLFEDVRIVKSNRGIGVWQRDGTQLHTRTHACTGCVCIYNDIRNISLQHLPPSFLHFSPPVRRPSLLSAVSALKLYIVNQPPSAYILVVVFSILTLFGKVCFHVYFSTLMCMRLNRI